MASENFKAKEIGLRAQKKLLSRMSNKTTLKLFIDDASAAILDNAYKLFKKYTGNKKEAEKLIKSIIKTVIKVGVLHRNDRFSSAELEIASKLRFDFQKTVMTIASFYELEFSYDYQYLANLLNDLRASLLILVRNHLTEKSLDRINRVFDFCRRKEFCDQLFRKNSPYREIMNRLVSDLNKSWEDGSGSTEH
ncbi:hypothetical protein V9T40_001645 [Parthenolecanium corni]|uniref:Tumor necrosis factor alpha-induced protein 8-like protein n=1 Tax=Parthenolecanium corni TaxID=536013 RepID=A0AAN9Y6I4_9HEMI